MIVLHSVIWELAAFGLVLFIFNRWLLLWVDGPVKFAAMATLGLSCAIGAGVAARSTLHVFLVLPTMLLFCFSLGEVRRLWLRHVYRAPHDIADSMPGIVLAHPETTTDLALTRYEVAANLTSRRIRIVHLTDLHLSRALPWDYFVEVREAVRREVPDIIVITGDFISKSDNLDLMRDWLRDFPQAPLGTFAVLGNHDYWSRASEAVKTTLAEHRIQWIAGRCEKLAVNANRSLVLCGTEKPWGPGARLEGRDPDDFVILLSHTPDEVYATSTQADIMLAGHCHGGQWRVPGLGSLVVPSRYGRRLDRGQFQIGKTRLFVSSGIGVDAPYLRLFCPPEIVVVDLI